MEITSADTNVMGPIFQGASIRVRIVQCSNIGQAKRDISGMLPNSQQQPLAAAPRAKPPKRAQLRYEATVVQCSTGGLKVYKCRAQSQFSVQIPDR